MLGKHRAAGAHDRTRGSAATFPERDHTAARDAIARVLAEERNGQARRGFDAYRRFHSRPQLDATFRQLIASLPRPAHPATASL